MHRRHKYDIIIVFSLLGFAISVYLATAHYLGFSLPCDFTKGCEAVLESKYSQLLGLPLAVWGVAFFTAIIIVSLLANHYPFWQKALTIILGAGALAAIVFLSIQFFIIRQVCQYCLVTDFLAIILFLFDLNIEHKRVEV